MGILDAFHSLLALKQRKMTLKRDDDSIELFVSPSAYQRGATGPSETIIEGRQFTISKKNLKAPFIPMQRGDRLVDPELGSMSIDTIEELYGFGDIIGYRVTTS
jgi:hypothetical protein